MPHIQISGTFTKHFGSSPEWLIQAPGRINLIGEHIDYLEGFVMPAAIDRFLTMAIRANGTDQANIWTSQLGDDLPVSFSLNGLKPFEGELYWLNYIGGVAEMIRREGIDLAGTERNSLFRPAAPASPSARGWRGSRGRKGRFPVILRRLEPHRPTGSRFFGIWSMMRADSRVLWLSPDTAVRVPRSASRETGPFQGRLPVEIQSAA